MLKLNLLKGVRNQTLKINNNYLYTRVSSLCIGLPKPNPKTIVILNDLPLNTTNSTLQELITTNNVSEVRKTEVEPGCAIHIIDQVAAEFGAQKIRDQLNLRANLKNTCLPSVVLHNLPANITAETINQAFSEFQPKAVRFSGKNNISITVNDPQTAIQVGKIVNDITLGPTKLEQHITKTPDGRFCVNVSNIPPLIDVRVALKQISNVVTSQVPTAVFSSTVGSTKVTVRLNHQKEYYNEDAKVHLERIARMISFPTLRPNIVSVVQKKKPVLFLHNIFGIPEEKLKKLCLEENSAERLQLTWRSKDIPGDLAVAYFKSETEAQQAIKWIKAAQLGQKKIKTSFQHVAEPAVRLTGFPSKLTKSKFFELFSSFKIARVDVLPSSKDTSDAIVVLSTKPEANKMATFVNQQNPGGYNMKAVENPVEDWCVEYSFPEGPVPSTLELQAAFQKENLSIKSISTDTNVSAYVAFDTYYQASHSQNRFLSGNIKLLNDSEVPAPTAYHGGGVISSSVSIYPSYAIEVIDVPQDQSAEYVVDAIKDDVNILKAHRSGTVKFKKHLNVVKGMQALSRVEVNGKKLKPIRNHPVLEEGDNEYDSIDNTDRFDREHYQFMLRDYLTAEPAIRYQMAKNYFERALFSAEGVKDISYLLDESAPSSIKLEARELLNARTLMNADIEKYEDKREPIPPTLSEQFQKNTNRLFELFIQREDMLKFSNDFAEIEASLGPASTEANDVTNWNNFVIENRGTYVDFATALRQFNPDAAVQILNEIPPKVKTPPISSKNSDDDESEVEATTSTVEGKNEENVDNEFEGKDIPDDNVDENGEKVEETENESKFSIELMRDHDGHLWHSILINDDTTQNVTSEGRVMSYRMLMVIGNFRGVGGYGMGKGKTPQLALTSAFRAALNNLVFIDLHENACFAHDLFGRENNCYVYIRATPKERAMVANPVMREMLNCFGVVSASVKVVGRRQPYAMVRAFFKAIGTHRNLDEIAKERGSRYLTLKWMQDKGL